MYPSDVHLSSHVPRLKREKRHLFLSVEENMRYCNVQMQWWITFLISPRWFVLLRKHEKEINFVYKSSFPLVCNQSRFISPITWTVIGVSISPTYLLTISQGPPLSEPPLCNSCKHTHTHATHPDERTHTHTRTHTHACAHTHTHTHPSYIETWCVSNGLLASDTTLLVAL